MGFKIVTAKAFSACRRLSKDRGLLKELNKRAVVGILRTYSTGEEIVGSPYGTMEFPSVLLHEYLFDKMVKFENKVALECVQTGRKYTYKKLRETSTALAASLQNKLKMQKGDVMTLFLPNVPEYGTIVLASSQCGAITTTINAVYKPDEVARQLKLSNSKIVFTTTNLYPVVKAAFATNRKTNPIVIVQDYEQQSIPAGTVNIFELMDRSSCGILHKYDITPDDVLLMPYSSGTTGKPKGVQLIHRNLVANIMQVDHAKNQMGIEFETEERVIGLLPMFHIYGLMVVLLTSLSTGAKVFTVPKFEPKPFLEALVKHQITSLYLVPPLVLFLAGHHLVKPEMLKSVKFIICGASPIGQADLDRLKARAPHIMVGQGYGMTEASSVVLLYNKKCLHKPGGTGVPLISTEVKIVDPKTLESLGPNKVGELWVKGPQVMKGYFNSPEINSIIFQDGWLKTGDLGYYDDEKIFFIADRIKDLIKVKGFQVAPAELEELLRTHPKITDAAVIGIPDEKKGEVPKAFVVLRKSDSATEEEIKAFVKERVADHKQLDGGVEFVEEIPKSASGKILKKDLRDK